MRSHRLSPLRAHGFRMFCTGNLASLLGTWAQRVAVMWLAWDLTHSTVVLGLVAFLDLIPALLTSPLGGSIADRPDRVRMAILVQYISILPPLILALATGTGWLTIEVLLAVTVVGGLCNGIDHPLRLTLVSSLVPTQDLPGAVSINSMIFNLSRMIGPALGGMMIAADALIGIFIANLVSFVAFAVALRQIRPEDRPRDPAGAAAEAVGAALPWSQVWRHVPLLQRLALLYLAALCFFMRPLYEMLPAFAARNGSGDQAATFALMSSAVGLGAFVGAVLAPGIRAARTIILLGLAGAVAISALAWIEALWLTLAVLSLSSTAILAGSISTQILLQTGVSPAIRGKVLSLYTMTLRGLPAAGAFLAGLLATRIELAMVFVWAGLPVFAIAGLLLAAEGRD